MTNWVISPFLAFFFKQILSFFGGTQLSTFWDVEIYVGFVPETRKSSKKLSILDSELKVLLLHQNTIF
jgi:hypothetical protein